MIGGTKPGGLNTIYDTHQVAIVTGLVLVVVYYVAVLPGAQGLEMQRSRARRAGRRRGIDR